MKRLLIVLMMICATLPACAIHDVSGNYKLEVANIGWWGNFGDEYLNQYIYRAIENNHDLKIATLKTQEYQQFVKSTQAGQLPTLSLVANYARIRMPGMEFGGNTMEPSNMNLIAVPLVASYEADIFLKNADKTKSAKKQYEASKHLEKATYISFTTSVATTYFNIIKLDTLIEEQEKISANRAKIYELTKLRNQSGLSSVFDVTMSNKAYTIARLSLNDLEKERVMLLNQLAVLIGETPNNIGELKRAKLNTLEYTKEIPSEISSEVALKRPDLMKAEVDLQRAGIDVRVARKEFLPKIPIMGVFGFNSTSWGSLFNWQSMLALIGAGITQDIFTGGIKTANLKTKKIQYEEALENYKKADLVAIQEINDALCQIKFDTKKDKENIEKYNLEEQNFKLVEERYKEGVISYLDLIQYEENLLVLNFDTTSSKVQRLVDYVGLFKSVGGEL